MAGSSSSAGKPNPLLASKIDPRAMKQVGGEAAELSHSVLTKESRAVWNEAPECPTPTSRFFLPIWVHDKEVDDEAMYHAYQDFCVREKREPFLYRIHSHGGAASDIKNLFFGEPCNLHFCQKCAASPRNYFFRWCHPVWYQDYLSLRRLPSWTIEDLEQGTDTEKETDELIGQAWKKQRHGEPEPEPEKSAAWEALQALNLRLQAEYMHCAID